MVVVGLVILEDGTARGHIDGELDHQQVLGQLSLLITMAVAWVCERANGERNNEAKVQ